MARGGRARRAPACLGAVVIFACAATACTGVGSRTGNVTPPQAGRSAASSPLASLTVEGAPFAKTFGGWSTDDEMAFRMALHISATGAATGKLTALQRIGSNVQRVSSAFTGDAGPWRAKTHDRRLHIRLSEGVDFNRTFYGTVDDRHVGLQPPSDSRSELGFWGSSVLVSKRFNSHARIITSRGGYAGWLRRQQLQRAAVHRVDVDGDGRRDLVTVVWSSLSTAGAGFGSGVRAVTVRFATGRVATINVPAMGAGRGVGWVGDLHLPGMTGRQIILFDGSGASNWFYRAVADVGGSLREVNGPGDGWNIGGTVGTGSLDEFCRGGVLHTTYEQYVANDHVHELRPPRITDSRWVWKGTHWALVGRTIIRELNQRTPRRFTSPVHHGLWGCG